MSAIQAFIKRHPAPIYFMLAFALSWGGVLWVVGGPRAIPGSPEQTARLFPFAYLAMLVGPSVAGLLMTGLVRGRQGYRDLLSRLLAWRVGSRWYAAALLIAPAVAATTLFVLSRTSSVFLPGILTTSDKAGLIVFGLVIGLGAGIFEELGWTGFAVPEMSRLHGVLATGLVVGLLWGAWHFLVSVWGIGGSAAGLPLAIVMTAELLAWLPPYRVLMVWVHERTGSLLVAMLMHASLTAGLLILGPGGGAASTVNEGAAQTPVISGVALVTYDLALGAAFWLVVVAVAVANHGHLSMPALRRRTA